LYYSHHYINTIGATVAVTVTPGCYNPPPFKKSRPKIYDGREFH
jgi:hypothetical protein